MTDPKLLFTLYPLLFTDCLSSMPPRALFLFLFLFCSINFLRAEENSKNHLLRAQEYTLLLNAVATKSDPHHLYSYKMEEDGFISRQGKLGHYSYQCLCSNAIMGDLTYFSALRFCNWMENECPWGEENLFTTEKGTYDLSRLTNENEDPSVMLTPKPGASCFLGSNNRVAIFSKLTFPANASIRPLSKLADGDEEQGADGAQQRSVQDVLDGASTDATQLLVSAVEFRKGSIDASLACSSIGFCIMTPLNLSITHTENASLSTFDDHSSINNIVAPSYEQQKSSLSLLSASSSVDALSPSPFLTTPNEDLSVNIKLVTIDQPYNQSDAMPVKLSDRNGDLNFRYGSVDHIYQIGIYDVTVGQYRNFLMAVARTADPYHLFNPAMQTNPNVCSIRKETNSIIENGVITTNYTYTIIQGMENYPITCVSYWSSIRFCNWLANGQPQDIGECNSKTTEDGSYEISNFIPRLRTNTATWRLPTQDEWYKAAYKVPNNKKEYWAYSTGNQHPHNSAKPKENQPDSPYKNANYCLNGTWTALSSPWITPVGVFSNSPGPCGTYDMGGNVAQIIDDSWTLVEDPTPGTGGTWKLLARGGSWRSTDPMMISAKMGYQYIDPNDASEGASETIGFRVVCAIPPPPPEKHTLYSTLNYMFHEDLENAREGNDGNLINISSYFMGLGLGFGIPYGAKKTLLTLGARGALIALGFTEATADVAILLTPYGLAACGCCALATYVYKANVNDQTPYDENPMMKRTSIGYVAGSIAWMILSMFL